MLVYESLLSRINYHKYVCEYVDSHDVQPSKAANFCHKSEGFAYVGTFTM